MATALTEPPVPASAPAGNLGLGRRPASSGTASARAP